MRSYAVILFLLIGQSIASPSSAATPQPIVPKQIINGTSLDLSGQGLTLESFRKDVLPSLKIMTQISSLNLSNNPALDDMIQIATLLAPLRHIVLIEPAILMLQVQALRQKQHMNQKKTRTNPS